MTSLKTVEWRTGSSAHSHQQRPRSQRDLVEASLLRRGPAAISRWDERNSVQYARAA